jgi:cap2 methyltransferase
MFRRIIPKCNLRYEDINTPAPSEILTKADSIRQSLNEQKSRLDSISLSLINSVMKSLDRYYSLHKILRRKYNAQIVTNAWLKCYELVNEFNLLDVDRVCTFRSIFLNAELPGSFICAINHYIVTQTPIEYDWLANSLFHLPYQTKRDPTGDRYGIYECNQDKWVMGKKHNGDVTDITTIDIIEDQVLSIYPNGINLYTSDIGVDVSDDYQHQEELNSLENLGQIILGLRLLCKGGNMVIKIYTYFTDYTLSLLIILSLVFDYTYIAKPLTSKPTNSELYVVCKGFNGISFTLMNDLTNRLITHKDNCTLPYIDGPFINLQDIRLSGIITTLFNLEVKVFGEQQLKTLEQAVNTIEEERSFKKWKKTKVVSNNAYEHNRWLFFNNIKCISSDYHIPTRPIL